MGVLEEIAVADLKLRMIVIPAMVVFLGVSIPAAIALKSALGFLIGGLAALITAALTAKVLVN